MMKTRVAILLLLLAALQPLSAAFPAQADPPQPKRSIASALQPFVDSHTLAGAVTLVATKDEVLSLEAVGYADIAQQKPMRPDCLFWIASQSKPITATDLSIFYRMILGGGVFQGKRYLSQDAVERMTSKQTGELPTAYGFSFSTGGQRIGHGGAYSTNTSIDQQHQLITVFLVQHAGWPNDGNKILPTFLKTATEAFASSPPKP